MATKTELEGFLKELKEDDNKEEGNYNKACPVKYTLGVIGGKWKLLILSQLLKKDVIRFNELKKKISGVVLATFTPYVSEELLRET